MAEVLENVLTQRILLNDFKLWLIADSPEISTDKIDFITYFLHYMKENCAWLISKNGKGLESPSFKLLKSEDKLQSFSRDHKSFHENATINSRISPKKKTDYDRSRNGIKYFQNDVQKKYPEKVPMSAFNEPRKGRDECYFPKSEYLARKNLNFNSTKYTKVNSAELPQMRAAVNSINYTGVQTSVPDISSFDAFPPVGSNVNNRNPNDFKTRRRITPTPIQNVQKGSAKFGNSRFVAPEENVSNEAFKKTPVMETPSSDLQEEREMLKITRNKFSQAAVMTNSSNILKIESTTPMKAANVHFVIPDPEKMGRKNELDVFSCIYNVLITNALVPNVTSELYFIFELITSKVLPEDKSDDENCVFSSVHNCVYFAISVLSNLQKLLHLLDNNTLSSLCEIPYLKKFSPDLVKFLQVSCKERQEISTKSQPLNRVPFLLEEDSRENFIDVNSFTTFRKQRDLFYELLRDWQQKPLDTIDAKFRESFSRKAKTLITLGPNIVNTYHLARLFQNQLIASCLGLEVSEVYDELLSDIQRNFPGKIEKLRQRFMMPFCVSGPNPPPTFYGIQAFFYELIQAAASVSLNQQLQDIFVCKILEFNGADIFSDGELSSPNTEKEKYIFLLHTLRLLGKFLGYLYFLPYKVSEPVSNTILNSQLISRKHSVPPLDILRLLKAAIENNRVILTIPWVIEFLSMTDPVGKHLQYIQESLEILTVIYRGKYLIPPKSLNFWFLRLTIGWLFDVLCYSPKCSLVQTIAFEKNIQLNGIDYLAVIDKQLIHSCCPYLAEFKVLIYSFLNGIKNEKKKDIRKITPLTTPKPHTNTSSDKQRVQTQLEENFFFIHPPSVKKTVEFISERIASKIINKIRSEITDFKLQSVEYIVNQESYKTLLGAKSDAVKKHALVDSCIVELYKKSQCKIADFMHIECPKDIKMIMPSLLSYDIKPSVLEMCCKISIRLAVDKITAWCDSNLLLEDIKSDIQNKLNHLSKGEGDSIRNDDLNLSSVLISLRQLIVNILSGSGESINSHIVILSNVSFIIEKPIANVPKKLIAFLTMDLYIAMLIQYPQNCNEELNKILSLILSSYTQNYNLENYFLGVQNVKFLITGKDLESSCEKLAFFLNGLIDDNVFCANKLKNCMKTLNSYAWNDKNSIKILKCVADVVLKYTAKT